VDWPRSFERRIPTTNSRNSRNDRKARNAQVVAGIDKDLAPLGDPVHIGGESISLSSLKATFSDDSAAIDATDEARKATQAAELHEKGTRARAAQATTTLRAFLIGYFGVNAVAVLGHFGMKPPKSKATRTVATKAVAVAKAKATRAARGTKGPVARQAVVGQVDAQAIKEAIDSPSATPKASAEPAAPAPVKPATPPQS
jgi:hypothetical protein